MLDLNKLQISTLCENSVTAVNFLGEWGLSVLISIGDQYKLLFDTGHGRTILHNADVLGINLSDIEGIVLSHGHNDHTGGLKSVLERIHYLQPDKKIDILCHPEAVKPKYVKNSIEKDFYYAAIPFSLDELERWGAKFKYSKTPTWLTENIASSGEIPLVNNVEQVTEICYLKDNDHFYADPVVDDQALFIITNLGLIVILGCAHRGMINTIQHARKVTGVAEVYMVMGGTHLVSASKERLDFTISQLKEIGVRKIGLSHCTGLRSAAYFDNHFPNTAFFYNNAGTVLTFKNQQLQIAGF
jgi:7,8-dihydropterin-6-yl-methyl-4-(beta-D-ribofuranosyl)aminobenzene 5'-phosphate synthase